MLSSYKSDSSEYIHDRRSRSPPTHSDAIGKEVHVKCIDRDMRPNIHSKLIYDPSSNTTKHRKTFLPARPTALRPLHVGLRVVRYTLYLEAAGGLAGLQALTRLCAFLGSVTWKEGAIRQLAYTLEGRGWPRDSAIRDERFRITVPSDAELE
ncbi:hypothetical protein K437DRAFT_79760 [Tilletiaria anomala UBC 951]|uniref:Uncharacterized protein n=1 Tax=Tilletiaria anomala (strain ATCC 24038 / CBS 436.72 / UBC 951) TaxID=1037660 RepID=A0A066W9J2_TILAU|nr:uncharacterized protein K437DRAFT_79760 [Tilletiaria anomala UBC 951]KDN49223.1 hypothetical protein K437DRAFT_79760 [Tilletiaria anomala UBC 951]